MNIQGIEVLNQEPVYTTDMRFFIGVLIIGILMLIVSEFFVDDATLFAIVVIIVGTAFIISLKFGQKETGRYRYEVTISDNVAFKELYEKYNIIEQKGKIYVIEEKEVEE